jgi:hypothetical protein
MRLPYPHALSVALVQRVSPSLYGVLALFIIAGVHQQGRAQSPSASTLDSTRWRVEASTGYYTQEGTDDPGLGVFVSVGHRLSTGFIGSFEFGIAQTYSRYNPRMPPFGGDRYYRTHYVFRLSFDYPFNLAKRHQLLLGTGIVYVQRYWTEPAIRVQKDPDGQGVLVSGTSDPTTPGSAGLHFTAKYQYRISRVALGLRVEAHLFQFERGGEYIVAPLITVHF